MDASFLRLDLSELTSAEGKRGGKKNKKLRDWFTDQAVKAEERMNATQLQRLTDVKCSNCFFCLSFYFTFSLPQCSEGKCVSEKLRWVIIPANREIFRLAINPVSALILVSGLLIFSTLISLLGQSVICSPLSPAAIIHCRRSHLRWEHILHYKNIKINWCSGGFSTKWVHLLWPCHPYVSNN